MEFQRQSRTICGKLTLLIFKVMEVQTILDVLLQIQDGGNFSDTEAKQL
jgi:hypothetical protein